MLPFTQALLRTLADIEAVASGYAEEMLDRIEGIRGKGEEQYEALLQVLSEIYVTEGFAAQADAENGVRLFRHEPGGKGGKNPELEARIGGVWCAVEVKAPKLIAHSRQRGEKPFQLQARLPREGTDALDATLPRDNPVKDFLVSAEEKFAAYELYRPGALRILVVVWNDFVNEVISALVSPISGLLTPNSFHTSGDQPVTYPHVDGVVVIRHQHQLISSTRCEPLFDGVTDPLRYWHEGFPPKALIQIPGGRVISEDVMAALNLTPFAECMGAEYMPGEVTIWIREQ